MKINLRGLNKRGQGMVCHKKDIKWSAPLIIACSISCLSLVISVISSLYVIHETNHVKRSVSQINNMDKNGYVSRDYSYGYNKFGVAGTAPIYNGKNRDEIFDFYTQHLYCGMTLNGKIYIWNIPGDNFSDHVFDSLDDAIEKLFIEGHTTLTN